MEQRRFAEPVLVACPDARPPAYQAVVGLYRARLLRSFMTSTYYDRDGHLATLLRRLAPLRFGRLESVLLRRHEPEIPPALVRTVPSFDVALRMEARMAANHPKITRCSGTLAHRSVRQAIGPHCWAIAPGCRLALQRCRLRNNFATLPPARHPVDTQHGPR